MTRVYIGYDEREHDAYEVCASSILRHASVPVDIIPLEQGVLRKVGLYDRPVRMEGAQRIDEREGRPFSTDFAFTRFLVPALNLYRGTALFVDCDFLFTRDIAELFDLHDETLAISVVKHRHIPSETVKMDGQSQGAYPRKNWSSLMLWNCEHPATKNITVKAVNYESGRWLHGLSWLHDEDIGSIPLTWNWLSGVSEPLDEVPSAIHYTLGIPTMAGYEDCPYADLWREERALLNSVHAKPGCERPLQLQAG